MVSSSVIHGMHHVAQNDKTTIVSLLEAAKSAKSIVLPLTDFNLMDEKLLSCAFDVLTVKKKYTIRDMKTFFFIFFHEVIIFLNTISFFSKFFLFSTSKKIIIYEKSFIPEHGLYGIC
jgi:hypothetical protein